MRGTAAGAFPGVAWPRPAGTVRARTLYLLYGADIQSSYGCAKGLLSSVPYEFFTGHTFLLNLHEGERYVGGVVSVCPHLFPGIRNG